MDIGYCTFHRKQISKEYAQTKGCECMQNTHKKCKYLRLYKSKEPFRYQPKHLRRK